MEIVSKGATLRCNDPGERTDPISGWQAGYNSIRSGGMSDRSSMSEAMLHRQEVMLDRQARSEARDEAIRQLTEIGIDRHVADKALPNEVALGASILENVRSVRGLSASEYIDKVRPGGPWDYKRDNHPENENWGNFNFGVTSRAWANVFFSDGIPSAWDKYLEDFVLRGAGFVQEYITHTSQDNWGCFLGLAHYEDDPRDQDQIKAGWELAKEIESPET